MNNVEKMSVYLVGCGPLAKASEARKASLAEGVNTMTYKLEAVSRDTPCWPFAALAARRSGFPTCLARHSQVVRFTVEAR
jgi:hypothetical protein